MTDGTSATDRMLERLGGHREALLGHLACPHGPAICSRCERGLLHGMTHLAATVFATPPPPRQNRQVGMLQRVAGDLRSALDRLDAFPDQAVLGIADWPQARERAALAGLVAQVDDGIAFLSGEVEATGSGRGGRNSDDRIRHAVAVLSALYEQHTGQRPTHVQDPDDGGAVSPFNRLVNGFFTAVYPEPEPPWAAIRERMRAACQVRFDPDTIATAGRER